MPMSWRSVRLSSLSLPLDWIAILSISVIVELSVKKRPASCGPVFNQFPFLMSCINEEPALSEKDKVVMKVDDVPLTHSSAKVAKNRLNLFFFACFFTPKSTMPVFSGRRIDLYETGSNR